MERRGRHNNYAGEGQQGGEGGEKGKVRGKGEINQCDFQQIFDE